MADIPPLATLRAFEAAARLGGFARAAAELNVSTSAVSHQIRGLEERLGARLLERSVGTGGVSVTQAGQHLLAATIEALDLLQDACSAIRGSPRPLTISANPPFSTMWLARRLAEFCARNPQTSVNALQEHAPDFSNHAVDLVINNVKPAALRPNDIVLFQENVFPVCSPALLSLATRAPDQCLLLEEDHDNSPEIDWRTWAADLGLPSDPSPKIVRYSSFNQVVGAALGGAGLALGRTPLITPELESGRLVRLRPNLVRPASWCFVLRRRPFRRHRLLEPLIEFLRSEAARPDQKLALPVLEPRPVPELG